MTDDASFTAFTGHRRLASGDLRQVAAAAAGAQDPVLIFEDGAGALVELDLRKGPEDAVEEYRGRTAPSEPMPARQRRGRPRLGVVAREVTLLPRHWDWLAGQPGGASAALRRLVEDARRVSAGPDQVRRAREAVYRIMSVLAGDLPGFEEASRALFAGDHVRLRTEFQGWPTDVADYLDGLVSRMTAPD